MISGGRSVYYQYYKDTRVFDLLHCTYCTKLDMQTRSARQFSSAKISSDDVQPPSSIIFRIGTQVRLSVCQPVKFRGAYNITFSPSFSKELILGKRTEGTKGPLYPPLAWIMRLCPLRCYGRRGDRVSFPPH